MSSTVFPLWCSPFTLLWFSAECQTSLRVLFLFSLESVFFPPPPSKNPHIIPVPVQAKPNPLLSSLAPMITGTPATASCFGPSCTKPLVRGLGAPSKGGLAQLSSLFFSARVVEARERGREPQRNPLRGNSTRNPPEPLPNVHQAHMSAGTHFLRNKGAK